MNTSIKKIAAVLGGIAIVSVLTALFTALWLRSVYLGAPGDDLSYDQKLAEIQEIIQQSYYKTISDEDLYTGTYRGMMWALEDPYSRYYSAEELSAAQEQREGLYFGIGVLLSISPDGENIIIVRAFRNSPAAAAGLRTGDRILAVDGEELGAYDLDRATTLLKGAEEGSEVIITVMTGKQKRDVAVTRAEVENNRVEYRMIEDIAYIEIFEFFGNDVSGFEEAIQFAKNNQAEGILLDLRDNPGGLVDDAVKIADMLLPGGKIVYTQDREGNQETWSSDAESIGLPLVVLVNEMSASSSEILAGAVQDHKAGIIVGEKTYGKGVVQTIIPFADGSGIQLTTSTFYTPNGHSIHEENGIEPDVAVEIPEASREEFKRNRAFLSADQDIQLQKAIEVLNAEIRAKAQEEAE